VLAEVQMVGHRWRHRSGRARTHHCHCSELVASRQS
jgi:hypothetical protein